VPKDWWNFDSTLPPFEQF